MSNNNGVYILVAPIDKDRDSKLEYRVAYLDSVSELTWGLDELPFEEAVDPAKVKPHFDKSDVYHHSSDAEEAAYRIADDRNITCPPIYHVYISTAYPEWDRKGYAQN